MIEKDSEIRAIEAKRAALEKKLKDEAAAYAAKCNELAAKGDELTALKANGDTAVSAVTKSRAELADALAAKEQLVQNNHTEIADLRVQLTDVTARLHAETGNSERVLREEREQLEALAANGNLLLEELHAKKGLVEECQREVDRLRACLRSAEAAMSQESDKATVIQQQINEISRLRVEVQGAARHARLEITQSRVDTRAVHQMPA